MSYEGYTGFELANTDKHLGGAIYQGDPYTYCPSVWEYVVKRFCVKSVLDLGAGRGYSSNYFFNLGCKVLAVDGLKQNAVQALYPTFLQDLTKGPVVTRVGLVHCHEMVEHIEEKYVDNLIDSLSCGDYILMTHALPGQPGHHHVNCKPKEYWVEKIKVKGYNLLQEDTKRVRKLAETDGAIYMAQSGLMFGRRG